MTEGQFVRSARENAGLSQYKLARKMGWTCAQFISNIERDLAGLPAPKMKRFAKVTGCDLDELIAVKENDYHNELIDAIA